MMHRIQACQNQAELSDVVSRFMPQIFPPSPDACSCWRENSSLLQSSGQWSDPAFSAPDFLIDDCWALRRGRPHISNPDGDDVVCHHLKENSGTGLCIPLTALAKPLACCISKSRCETIRSRQSDYIWSFSRKISALPSPTCNCDSAGFHGPTGCADRACKPPLSG